MPIWWIQRLLGWITYKRRGCSQTLVARRRNDAAGHLAHRPSDFPQKSVVRSMSDLFVGCFFFNFWRPYHIQQTLYCLKMTISLIILSHSGDIIAIFDQACCFLCPPSAYQRNAVHLFPGAAGVFQAVPCICRRHCYIFWQDLLGYEVPPCPPIYIWAKRSTHFPRRCIYHESQCAAAAWEG